MIDFSRIFGSLVLTILIIGMSIGVFLCGFGWFLYWLYTHISISWIS